MCTKQADIVFVLDMSGSIGQQNWNRLIDFVINIVNKLTISKLGIHVGVVTYSNDAQIAISLDKYFDQAGLIAAIRNIVYQGGGTNTASGLLLMKNGAFDPTRNGLKGDRKGVENLAIVITDGRSSINEDMTIPTAEEAKNDKIKLLVVGITSGVNEDELRGISSSGILGDTYWLSEDFNVTNMITRNIISKTCDIIEPGIFNDVFQKHFA